MNDGERRRDEGLGAAFAALRQAEEAGAPPLSRLLAASPRRYRQRRRAGARAGLPARAVRAAAATAVLIAAGLGLWLGRLGEGPGPAGDHGAVALADWVAPTDFLLETPGIELLRATPRIPSPPPVPWEAFDTDPASGGPR